MMAHTLEAQQQPPTTASRYSSVPSHTDRVSPPQYHNNNKSSSVSVVEWPLCFWAAQTVAAKMEYDLGYQRPDDDEPSPPPEAKTQDLGEGVEADDICNIASVENQHNPPLPPVTVRTVDEIMTSIRCHNIRSSLYDVKWHHRKNLSHTISSSKRRARNKTRWEEIRRRRESNMKRRGESYCSASDSHHFSVGTNILLRNRIY